MLKVIACDLDGIFTDLFLYQIWMVYDYYVSKGLTVPEIKNPEEYGITKVFGIPKNERNAIWLEYYKPYCQRCMAHEQSFETAKEWQGEGRKVPLVTGRAFATLPIIKYFIRRWVNEWLELYKFKPDGIYWVPEKDSGIYKAKVCHDLKADIIIDDKATNFDYLLDVCPVATLNTPWNIDYYAQDKPNDLYRANNWLQIKEIIQTLDINNPYEIAGLLLNNRVLVEEYKRMFKDIEYPPKSLLIGKEDIKILKKLNKAA